jgi:2-polyprenyl-6-hydroxyphenyl methylase/3-demethylubiquinone-9 3-methyltransferase
MLRTLIEKQIRLSRSIDHQLPKYCSRDGYQDFNETVVPDFLQANAAIYDVGGGKRPYLTPEAKQALGARVVGVDIDGDELAHAPDGAYDETITADIAHLQGRGDADLVICQTVLEHVRDIDGSMSAIASMLKPGGRALIFVPCRNALFARLNLLLPETVKRKVLYFVDPRTAHAQGFPSHYKGCTPDGLRKRAEQSGLEVEREQLYWTSSYFYAFVPAYLVWRTWLLAAKVLGVRNMCETFTLVLRKPEAA